MPESSHLSRQFFFNSVRLAQTLLDRRVRVCGTLRANRGIPRDIKWEDKHLRKGQTAFWKKVDLMLQVWKDKRLEQIISTIHDATIVNTERKTNIEIKKALCCCPVK